VVALRSRHEVLNLVTVNAFFRLEVPTLQNELHVRVLVVALRTKRHRLQIKKDNHNFKNCSFERTERSRCISSDERTSIDKMLVIRIVRFITSVAPLIFQISHQSRIPIYCLFLCPVSPLKAIFSGPFQHFQVTVLSSI